MSVPRVLDEGRQLFAERPGVLLIQVDLVGRAADREPHCLVGRAALKIVFERDGYLRRHPGLPLIVLFARYKINCHAVVP